MLQGTLLVIICALGSGSLMLCTDNDAMLTAPIQRHSAALEEAWGRRVRVRVRVSARLLPALGGSPTS